MSLSKVTAVIIAAGAVLCLQATATHAADTEWRAFINGTCIVTDEPFLLPQNDDGATTRVAPLFGMLASKLASTLISGAATGISSRAARKDTTFVAAEDFHLYVAELSESPETRINPQLGCISIVAGNFEPANVDCTAEYLPRELVVETVEKPSEEWQTTRTDESVENVLRRANICLSGPPAAVYEARIQYSDDNTAYRMSSAGYWINALNTTRKKNAQRSLLYTLEMIEPTETAGGRVLSTAWVNLGSVRASSRANNDIGATHSEWLRVPSISKDARRVYDDDTAVHQEVAGKVEALERSVLRDARLLAGIRVRAEKAEPDVRAALDKEMSKISVRLVTSEAMLDARQAEYDDLPLTSQAYMPITMRIGVTESRDERRTMQALASVLKANSASITKAASQLTTYERSFDLDPDAPDLKTVRSDYYDAVVALNIGQANAADETDSLEHDLAAARDSYNQVRVAEGLAPIE